MEIAPKRRLGSKSHLAVPTFQIHNLAPAPNRNPGVNSCYSKLDFGSRSPNTLLSKVQLVHRELCRSPACSLSRSVNGPICSTSACLNTPLVITLHRHRRT
ncbi:hypothetical protein HGRIS_013989 [Hohenbuehelia grisea]|uniref:Uncharacterized protein n=1 Tax=Hohenbuehelia grisea TaxID=104357 RepID=A0ABR3JSU7_9AGAR